MGRFRRLLVWPLLVLLLVGPSAFAACDPNDDGGPSELVITVGDAGTDVDVGWTGELHNLRMPAASVIHACLEDCDDEDNSDCDATTDRALAADRALGPPQPVPTNLLGFSGLCLVTRLGERVSGAADVDTGDLDVAVSLRSSAYLSRSTFGLCPTCSGDRVGAAGVCDDTAVRRGQACTVEALVDSGGQRYAVSRDCLPGGSNALLGGAMQFDVALTTGTSMLPAPRPCGGSQTGEDACATGGQCNVNCSATPSGRGGINQTCCSSPVGRPCFPTRAGSPITRTGTPAPPRPPWPGRAYPKRGTGTVVATSCASSTGNRAMDPAVGLPGPVAVILPIEHEWLRSPTTTTPATTLPPTTLPPGCRTDGECVDQDPCTADTCQSGQCSHVAPPAELEHARCLLAALPASCGAEVLGRKLERLLEREAGRAEGAVVRLASAATPKKARKLRSVADRSLGVIVRRAAKLVKRGKLSAECAQRINAAIETARRMYGD